MGAEKQDKSDKGRARSRKLIPGLIILALLISGFLGWIYWERFQDIFDLQAEVARLKEKKTELREQISELSEQLNRRNDLRYIEKLAKEELGFVYPEEEKD